MKIIDVTVTLTPTLPTWPGDPKVLLERVAKIEEGANHNGSTMAMRVHVGTHVDAPFHFLEHGSTVETLPLEWLIGPAQVVELDKTVNFINAEVLVAAGIQPGMQRLLFKTRNSSYWSEHPTEFMTDFVGVTADGAEFLVWQGIHLVGVDYLSVAPYHQSRETHQILLQHEVVVVEGLDLSAVTPGIYQLICLPMKLGGSDGAPARAVLMQEDGV